MLPIRFVENTCNRCHAKRRQYNQSCSYIFTHGSFHNLYVYFRRRSHTHRRIQLGEGQRMIVVSCRIKRRGLELSRHRREADPRSAGKVGRPLAIQRTGIVPCPPARLRVRVCVRACGLSNVVTDWFPPPCPADRSRRYFADTRSPLHGPRPHGTVINSVAAGRDGTDRETDAAPALLLSPPAAAAEAEATRHSR